MPGRATAGEGIETAWPVVNDLLILPLAQLLESFLVVGNLGPDAAAVALSGC